MRISNWSSDVCSSDLQRRHHHARLPRWRSAARGRRIGDLLLAERRRSAGPRRLDAGGAEPSQWEHADLAESERKRVPEKERSQGQELTAGGQSEVLRLLADPATYGGAVDKVERIDTHGAIVFLEIGRAHV